MVRGALQGDANRRELYIHVNACAMDHVPRLPYADSVPTSPDTGSTMSDSPEDREHWLAADVLNQPT